MCPLMDKELKQMELTAGSFARRELTAEREKHDQFPFGPFWEDIVNKAFEVGFFHVLLPESFGGIGGKMTPLCIILRNLAEYDASLAGIIFANSLAHEIMLEAGCEERLGEICDGSKSPKDFLIGFQAFLNPGEVQLTVTAKIFGNEYRLSGRVEYLVSGSIAEKSLIAALVEGTSDFSYFWVNLDEAGVKISEPIFSLGLHACPAVDVELSSVTAIRIGEISSGRTLFHAAAERMSAAAAAISAGIMAGSFREAFDYARDRYQGGRPILKWSEVQMMLSGMAVESQIADMAVSRACEAVDGKQPGWAMMSRAAAIHVSELAAKATNDGIQILGGAGYMKDFGQEKRFRDAQHVQALLGIAPLKKIYYINKLID